MNDSLEERAVDARTIGRCRGCPPGEGVTTLVDGLCSQHRGYAAFEGGYDPSDFFFDD